MAEYPPFQFEWQGVADGGLWVVGWPGLEPGQYRPVRGGFLKRRDARRAYLKWLDEQRAGRIITCPTCHGTGPCEGEAMIYQASYAHPQTSGTIPVEAQSRQKAVEVICGRLGLGTVAVITGVRS